MQSKTLLLALFVSLLFLNACKSDDDVIIDDPIVPPIEENFSFEIQATADGESFIFTFDDCGFDDPNLQRQTNSIGTIGSDENLRNRRGLNTRIYNRDTDNTVLQEIGLGLDFSNDATDGLIDKTVIEGILASEIGSYRSEDFGVDFNIEIDGKTYSNTLGEYDSDLDKRYYTYFPDFFYDITDYDTSYKVDCMEKEALKIKGGFEGTFYTYEFGDIVDSIYLEVPEFEVLLLFD